MLVSVGRAPQVELSASRLGVELDRLRASPPTSTAATVDHIYAVGDCAGYWQLAHTAFREGESRQENAMGHEAVVDNRAVPRPIYTDPDRRRQAHAEQAEQYGDDVEVGMFPWVANARAVMQNETTGWVKSIHESRYGELLGLVMVGPHVTDADRGRRGRDRRRGHGRDGRGRYGRPPDPLGGDQAGLVALGRAVHLPNPAGSQGDRLAGADRGRAGFAGASVASASVGPCQTRSGSTAKQGTAISSAAPTRTVLVPTTSARGPASACPTRHEDQRDHPVE